MENENKILQEMLLNKLFPFLLHSILVSACIIIYTFEHKVVKFCIWMGLPEEKAAKVEYWLTAGLMILLSLCIIKLLVDGYRYLISY